ncbi:MAG: hypothetical protein MJ025_07090, partial [Victivallaceae bacterium]|nr:hypothetical protein [Victivallaceae bacterium]
MRYCTAIVAAMSAALCYGAVSGPSPDRPLMIQRFSQGQELPGTWERTLSGLEANRACADEVWFSNGTCFPSLERHAEQARRMAKCAADLRAIGIVPSLQIQATIGHGDNPRFTAEDMAGRTWGGYVGKNGEVCKQGNCPRQEGFLSYLREMSELYAAWHPGSVWIDDDLRMNNHAPAMSDGGCHCETCVGLFSKREGRRYTRESLVAACAADPELAKRWTDFGTESLAGVAGAIADGFHRISPETRIGLQHNKIPERVAIFRKLQENTGMRSASRPGGYDYTAPLLAAPPP